MSCSESPESISEELDSAQTHEVRTLLELGPVKKDTADEDYTEDFDSTFHSNPAYSSDFESTTSHVPPRPSSRKSLSSLRFSEDFETQSIKTQPTSVDYTDTFETSSTASVIRTESVDYSVTENIESELSSESYSESGSIQSVIPSTKKSFIVSTDDSKLSSSEESDTRGDSFSEYTVSEISSYDSSTSTVDTEENDAKLDFIQRKIHLMKTQTKPIVQEPDLKDVHPKRKITKREDTFCRRKVELLNDKKYNVPKRNVHKRKEQHPLAKSRVVEDGETVDMYGIPTAIVNKLKFENTLEAIKKSASQNLHQPRNCPMCRETLAAVACKDFIKEKTTIATEKLVKEKVEENTHTVYDPIALIGEGLKTLPKLTDHPQSINDRLYHPYYTAISNSKSKSKPVGTTYTIPEFVKTLDDEIPQDTSRKAEILYNNLRHKLQQNEDLKQYAFMSKEDFWKKYLQGVTTLRCEHH